MIVYRASGPDGIFRLYRRSMDHFDSVEIADTENGANPFFSPDGQWLGFTVARTLKRVSLAGGPSQILAELPDYPRGASWDDAGYIVVGAASSGLLRVPEGGGNPTSVAAAGEGRRLWYPQVLPGGRAVLFTESRFNESLPRSDAPELQVLELETGRRRVLLPGLAGRFASTGHIVFVREGTVWAIGFDADRLELAGTPVPVVEGIEPGPFSQLAIADAGALAYVAGGREGSQHLVWVDRQGREQIIPVPPRGFTYPRLSPDGTQVALDVREGEIDIWICDLSRQTLRRLTFDPAQDEYPVWSRDGRSIFFASFRNQRWGVFAQAADGTGNVRLVGAGASELDPMSLSADGRRLVVRQGGDLLLLPLNPTGNVLPLLSRPFNEVNGEISPDDRWIAFQSNESGRDEVYVRPFPAVNDGLWQISASGGRQPLWARNGRELFYLGPAGLMSIPIETKGGFQFGQPTVVLEKAADRYWFATAGRAYDVSPDGQRFLMLKEDPQAAARLLVVQNWFDELKRLVPTN
jgi:serine/threonine-protein kinase